MPPISSCTLLGAGSSTGRPPRTRSIGSSISTGSAANIDDTRLPNSSVVGGAYRRGDRRRRAASRGARRVRSRYVRSAPAVTASTTSLTVTPERVLHGLHVGERHRRQRRSGVRGDRAVHRQPRRGERQRDLERLVARAAHRIARRRARGSTTARTSLRGCVARSTRRRGRASRARSERVPGCHSSVRLHAARAARRLESRTARRGSRRRRRRRSASGAPS